jgi:SAM-dependent methyltransferase
MVRRHRGPFAIQTNNTTRSFEYPWAFFARPVTAGLSVVELGGGLSGFQFVLSKCGCKVTNVDPGTAARGLGWACDPETIARCNRLFGTSVALRNTHISSAQLPRGSFDRVYSISVIEHMTEDELAEAVTVAYDCLKPGGFFVLTVDLFLDVAPFSSAASNEFGRNVNVCRLIQSTPFRLVEGKPEELFGFECFDHDNIQRRLSEFLIGSYPALAQCLVLQKPL